MSDAGDAQSDQEVSAVGKKQTRGKEGKKAKNKKADLDDFDMEAELAAAEAPDPKMEKPKPAAKGKKGGKVKEEVDEPSEDDGPGEPVKSKKAGKKTAVTHEVDMGAVLTEPAKLPSKPAAKGKKNVKANEEESAEEDERVRSTTAAKGKKGKKNLVENVDMESEPTALEAEVEKPPSKPTAKGKKNAKLEVDDEEADEPAAVIPAVKSAKGKKGRKGAFEQVDVEAELAALDAESKVNETEKAQAKPAPGKAKKAGKNVSEEEEPEKEEVRKEETAKTTKGKKGKKNATEDIDMEAEPAALDAEAKAEKPAGKGKKGMQAEQEEAEAPKEEETTGKAKKSTKKGASTASGPSVEPAVDKSEAADAKKGETGAAKKPGAKVTQKDLMKEHLRKIQEEKERLMKEEEERIRQEEEAEQQRLDEIQKEKERKEKKKAKEKERKEKLKAEGRLLTPKQKADQARAQAMLEALKAQGVTVGGAKGPAGPRKPPGKKTQRQASDETTSTEATSQPDLPANDEKDKEEDGEEEAESDEAVDNWEEVLKSDNEDWQNEEPITAVELKKGSVAKVKEAKTVEDGVAGGEVELTVAKEGRVQKLGQLRSAVVCVMGHVDTGKTKILDKIRRTNVQDMEAGGITQQIGATMVPADAIQTHSSMVRGFAQADLRLPGLLIIDTPGHESFSNLRSRGSSLCDIAILVVDIMHGLEPQTIESLNMLRSRKTPFIVALNKVDRLFSWKSFPQKDIRDAVEAQAKNVQNEFRERVRSTIVHFAEQGMNAALFYENSDPKTFISMVPTSAHSGDGMGNLMALIVDLCQTMLAKRLTFSNDLACTVLEVKELTGLGTTVDVILTNGTLTEGDTIVLAGFEGPIVTQVRGLLMPQPLKELRVKNAYEKHKTIHGAQGVKILAKDLENCLAGLPLYVAKTPDEVEKYKSEIQDQLDSALKSMSPRADKGVYVQASTLGSLEALLEFLKTSKIPYFGINIGPVHKKDVRNASAMLEHNPQYAVILAFDVKIEREAQLLADELGIRIFAANIIYHLYDSFTKYLDDLKEKKREENKHLAIFPCKLKILPQFIFGTRDPIIVGVVVDAGLLKIGTPITVQKDKEFIDIGTVVSIELNHKPLEVAKKGQEVCVKIEADPGSAPKMLGRHFEIEDVLLSKISRPSIDVCKDYFRDDLTKADWQLMVELKKMLNIF
ncbi:hypothetical protein RvY_08352 [Ramazzottius varieornatus]|uniref:Eukaryotic translation initiation factor 5B n=1 Tax=Ramazzottius varieornatus TaxID=947166 RepID=A0A1D1V5I5_RAMVA|nr:hypothetical protein RvY_08352 [Ramazzottius varieornatus]